MKATKVYELRKGGVRIYHLSEYIKKGKSDLAGDVDIVKSMEKELHTKIKEEYRDVLRPYFTNPEGINYVGISDSKEHIERLAFIAFPIENTYSFLPFDIAGKHTMLITGGDLSSIYDDVVYLRYLCRLNGLKWEGVEE